MVIITVYLEDVDLVTATRPSDGGNDLDGWSYWPGRRVAGNHDPDPHVGTLISGVSRCAGSWMLLVEPTR